MIKEFLHSLFTHSVQPRSTRGLDSTLVPEGPITVFNISNQDYIFVEDLNLRIPKTVGIDLGQFYTQKQILESVDLKRKINEGLISIQPIGASPSLEKVLIKSIDSLIVENVNVANTIETKTIKEIIEPESFITTDTFQNARPNTGDIIVDGYKSKTIFIVNTGTNPLNYNILASVDGNNYDFFITKNGALNGGSSAVLVEDRAFYSIRIEVKSKNLGASTTIITKGYLLGV